MSAITNEVKAPPRSPKRASKLGRREAIDGMLMALPWVIGFILLTVGPMLFGLYVSFTKWDIVSSPKWVGFDNYVRMFSGKDRYFYQALKVTFLYTILSVPIHVVLDIIIASLLNMKLKGTNIFRSIFYLPYILPIVATVVLWSWVFNADYGLVNYALSLIGIQGPKWLQDQHWALFSIVIMNLQYLGFGMMVMLAGLQRVPIELYEAASMDGAGWWHRLRHITLPMTSSVIFYIVIIHISGSIQTFTQSFLLTNGGPNYATYFYMLHLYNEAWRSFRMGYASALAWVLFLIILAITILNFRLSRYWVYTD
jgi:multiple sugar transport system permease protein